jgi:hypothetical protein
MVRGERGKFGIRGNVVSISYGSHWTGQGPNPTLSAIFSMAYEADMALRSSLLRSSDLKSDALCTQPACLRADKSKQSWRDDQVLSPTCD